MVGWWTCSIIYGWNAKTNLLFVDQPARTGFSYQDEGGRIPDNSFVAASNMADFLILFTTAEAFRHLKTVPLHIATESYGGHYVPPLANQIVRNNAFYGEARYLDLRSVLIGNGYISAFYTIFGYWTTLCTTWPGVVQPIFNETRCDIIATNTPHCLELGRVCNANSDPAICQAALTVCNQGVASLYSDEAGSGRRNIFDITAPCITDPFCDPRVGHIEHYLNLPDVRAALGVRPGAGNFSIADGAVEDAFHQTNDLAISSGPEIRNVLESGIDVLIYNGNLDLGCNTAGNLKWADDLEWKGQTEF